MRSYPRLPVSWRDNPKVAGSRWSRAANRGDGPYCAAQIRYAGGPGCREKAVLQRHGYGRGSRCKAHWIGDRQGASGGHRQGSVDVQELGNELGGVALGHVGRHDLPLTGL